MRECEYYEELISRLVDSELNKNEYDALWMHIKNCSRCNAMYAVFNAMSDIMADDTVELPEGLHENIMAGVRRNDIIKKNRFTVSKPLRNALAAAACAVFVIFAARGLSPADRAKDVAMTGSEAAVMTSAPAERPAQSAAPETAPAAEAAPVSPGAVPAADPAAPIPTRDIYLSDNGAVQSTPSAPPAVFHTQASVAPPAETPLVALTPMSPQASASVSAPAVESPAPTDSAAAPAAQSAPPMTVKSAAPAKSAAPVKSAAPANGTPVTEDSAEAVTSDTVGSEAVSEPEATDSPSLLSRGIKALFAAPNKAAAAPAASEAETAPAEAAAESEEAAPPAAAAAPVRESAGSPVISEAKKDAKDTVTRAVLRDDEDTEALIRLLDGTEKTLPTAKADKVFKLVFDFADTDEVPVSAPPEAAVSPGIPVSPDVSPAPGSDDDAKEKLYVFFFGKEVYFVTHEEEGDRVFLAKCTTEEFEKFIDGLKDVSTIPAESPLPSPSDHAVSPDPGASLTEAGAKGED